MPSRPPSPSHRHVSRGREPEPKPDSPEQAEYDDLFANWMVPSHDKAGHSERENVRFTPGVIRAMQIIVESGKTPYQTKSDLIRHAVYNHLMQIEKLQSRAGKHFLVGLRLSQQITQDETYRQELEKLFQELEKNIRYHLGRGETGEATRQAGILWQELSRVSESPWKRQAATRFLIQYGSLLGWRPDGAQLPTPAEPAEEKEHGE